MKKKLGAGVAWEKNQEPEPFGKKAGAGAAKKIMQLPSPAYNTQRLNSYSLKFSLSFKLVNICIVINQGVLR